MWQKENIVVLNELQAVRKRPGMFFGNLGAGAVEHVISELVSNSIDEFLAGHASEVRVTLTDDVIEVADDGRGLPFDSIGPDGKENLATYNLTHLHYTRSADNHAPHIHTHGLFGVGLAPVNAVSASFKCQSWRDGNLWKQAFSNGCPLSAASIIQQGSGRGSTITVVPNAEILEAAKPRNAVVRAQLFQAAHLFPGLTTRFQDEVFHAPQGLADLIFIQFPGSRIEQWHWADRPAFYLQTKNDDITIQAAAFGIAEKQCHWRTWVNGSPTVDHGSHRMGFSDALRNVKWKPVVALLHVVMHDPRYAGPTKDRLILDRARRIVSQGILPALTEYCCVQQLGRFDIKQHQ